MPAAEVLAAMATMSPNRAAISGPSSIVAALNCRMSSAWLMMPPVVACISRRSASPLAPAPAATRSKLLRRFTRAAPASPNSSALLIV